MAQTSTGVTAGNDALETWADAVVADITELYSLVSVPADLNYQTGSTGSSFSTTSSSNSDVSASLVLTITTTGGPVLIVASGGMLMAEDDNVYVHVVIEVNGSDDTVLSYLKQTGSNSQDIYVPFTVHKIEALAAGTHTIKLRWRSGTGGVTCRMGGGSGDITITAVELKA